MENRNGNTVLFTVIGVATLLVALVGATFAYFTATITNSSSQSISIVTAAPVALVTGDSGASINLTNAVPGTTSGIHNFTVGNTASGANNPQSYDLSLAIDSNGFRKTCTTDTITTTNCSDATTIAALADQLELTIAVSTSGGTASTLKMATTTDGAQNDSGAQTTDSILKSKSSNTVVYNVTDGTATNASYKLVNDQRITVNEVHTYAMSLNFKEVGYNQNANSGNKTFQAHLVIEDVKILTS